MTRWVSTHELVSATYRLAARLPPDIDAIVGMARSGLLPASLLASHLHLPLYAACQDRVTAVGGGWRSTHIERKSPRHLLLVDDTACTGRSMGKTLPWVLVAFAGAYVQTAAIYATPETVGTLDYTCEELPNPHYLEWNFFNSGFLGSSAFDMDGILCADVPVECDDDGERYVETLTNAEPLYLPRRQPIPAIITGRLEKYRSITVDWLVRHGLAAARVQMWPWSFSDRARPGVLVQWKAQQYAAMTLELLVESDPQQAEPISHLSGKPVLCPAAGKVFGS